MMVVGLKDTGEELTQGKTDNSGIRLRNDRGFTRE